MALGRKLGIQTDIRVLFYDDAMSTEEVLQSLSAKLPYSIRPSYMQVCHAKLLTQLAFS